MCLATEGNERIGVAGRDPGLLRFLSGIDLHVESRRASPSLDFGPQDLRKTGSVEGLDDVEEGDRLAGLVGLQGADKPKLKAVAASLPALHGLLHAILAEHSLPRRQHRFDGRPGLQFRYSRECDIGRIAVSRLCGRGYARDDFRIGH